MSTRPPTPRKPRPMPLKDRRSPDSGPGASGTLRRLKGALGRPLAVEEHEGHLRIVLVDRRRGRACGDEPSLDELCAELRGRLLACEPGEALRSLRQLALVHDALKDTGWPGVAALPAAVIAQAIKQATALVTQEPSPLMTAVIERLRLFGASGQAGGERHDARATAHATADAPDVFESTFEDFRETQRTWLDTLPAVLNRSKPEE